MAKAVSNIQREDASPLCVAVIGDLVGSRRIEARQASHQKLKSVLHGLNVAYAGDLLAPFTISRGDEFQGLLRRGVHLPDIIWEAEAHLGELELRFGIGVGVLNLWPNAIPMETDGPVWWAARHACDLAESTKRQGGVFVGFEENDVPLTAFATLLQHVRSRMTDRQRAVIGHLRAGDDFVAVAERLRITKQAVRTHAVRAGWSAYREGESAWRQLLNRYDFGSEWGAT